MTHPADEVFLLEAIRLAVAGVEAAQGGPFGSVVVQDGRIVGRGCNQVTSALDPTAHAEIVAIRDACRTLQTFTLAGCTVYASCEPCPMCLAACYWARVDRVVFAATSSDAAAAGFDDSMIASELGLPVDRRSLAITHLPHPETAVPFKAWQRHAPRIPY